MALAKWALNGFGNMQTAKESSLSIVVNDWDVVQKSSNPGGGERNAQ